MKKIQIEVTLDDAINLIRSLDQLITFEKELNHNGVVEHLSRVQSNIRHSINRLEDFNE